MNTRVVAVRMGNGHLRAAWPLAEALGVPRRDVTLVRGASARRKRVCVVGLSLEQLRARLAHAC